MLRRAETLAINMNPPQRSIVTALTRFGRERLHTGAKKLVKLHCNLKLQFCELRIYEKINMNHQWSQNYCEFLLEFGTLEQFLAI